MILTDARDALHTALQTDLPNIPIHGSMPGAVDGTALIIMPNDNWISVRAIGLVETNWTVRVLGTSLAGWVQLGETAETAWKACRKVGVVSGVRALEFHAPQSLFTTEFDVALLMEVD